MSDETDKELTLTELAFHKTQTESPTHQSRTIGGRSDSTNLYPSALRCEALKNAKARLFPDGHQVIREFDD